MAKEKIEEPNKRNKETNIFVIGIIALIIVGVVSAFIVLGQSYFTGNTIADTNNYDTSNNNQEEKVDTIKIVNPIQKCREQQVPYQETETYTETVQYTDRECEQETLPYKVENEGWITSACEDYNKVCYEEGFFGCKDEETFCVKKTLKYKADLTNLDLKEAGYFSIDFKFYKNGNELYNTISVNHLVYPQSSDNFLAVLVVNGDSPNGDANANWGATYIVPNSNLPKKIVCRDVLKYREEPRTKTTTKYRTETICD